MNPQINTYCSKEFLEVFFDINITDLSEEDQDQFSKIRKLVKQRSHLFLETGMHSSNHPAMKLFLEDLGLVTGSNYEWCYNFEDLFKGKYYLEVSTLGFETKKAIQTGEFGADMKVRLLNDGPVTIIIDSKNKI